MGLEGPSPVLSQTPTPHADPRPPSGERPGWDKGEAVGYLEKEEEAAEEGRERPIREPHCGREG